MAKVHKITLLVIDCEEYRDDDIEVHYQNMRHYSASHILDHEVKKIEWDDDHPLNKTATMPEQAVEIFNKL